MIPQFPEFEKLSLAHKEDIHAITWQYEPYSDYNFTSLWIWDIDEEVEVSQLHGNIIVRFTGYGAADKPFYSFIGTNEVVNTSQELLTYSIGKGLKPELQLIPEFVVNASPELSQHFTVSEDRDHIDYILSVPEWVSLEGAAYKKHRKAMKKFIDHHDDYETILLNPRDAQDQQKIRNCVAVWAEKKIKQGGEVGEELASIERLFKSAHDHDIGVVAIAISGIVRAIQVFEVVQHQYAVAHYYKADPSYPGIFQYLDGQTMRHLHERDVVHFNIEQDLGLQGLRTAKLDARPVHFLKKYTIRPRT
jgi:hypothetical protein